MEHFLENNFKFVNIDDMVRYTERLFVQNNELDYKNMAENKKRRKSKYDLRNKSLEKLDEQVAQVANENKERKLLQREMREMALERVEKAARTIADFEEVVNLWDLIDSNREKVDEKYLLYTHPDKPEYGEESRSVDIDKIADYITIYPPPYRDTLNTRYWRQVISGNFLDFMFDCAYEVHQSTARQDISKAIEQLTDNQKEIFYMVAIEGKSAEQIAKHRGQTPRNIRKVYKYAIESIHKYLKQK